MCLAAAIIVADDDAETVGLAERCYADCGSAMMVRIGRMHRDGGAFRRTSKRRLSERARRRKGTLGTRRSSSK